MEVRIMDKSMKWMAGLLFVVATVSIAMLSGVSDLGAQSPGRLQQQIQGNWTLVSIYNEWPDGRKLEQFGPDPRGSMMITPDGRFSIFFMKASIPKFASNNRIKGTDEENRAVVRGCTAYFGRYTVSGEKEGVVMLMIEGSTFPNWDGQKQRRLMFVSGDTLKVVTPASGIGGTSHIVWKRASFKD
jgi:hypothetical protein